MGTNNSKLASQIEPVQIGSGAQSAGAETLGQPATTAIPDDLGRGAQPGSASVSVSHTLHLLNVPTTYSSNVVALNLGVVGTISSAKDSAQNVENPESKGSEGDLDSNPELSQDGNNLSTNDLSPSSSPKSSVTALLFKRESSILNYLKNSEKVQELLKNEQLNEIVSSAKQKLKPLTEAVETASKVVADAAEKIYVAARPFLQTFLPASWLPEIKAKDSGLSLSKQDELVAQSKKSKEQSNSFVAVGSQREQESIAFSLENIESRNSTEQRGQIHPGSQLATAVDAVVRSGIKLTPQQVAEVRAALTTGGNGASFGLSPAELAHLQAEVAAAEEELAEKSQVA